MAETLPDIAVLARQYDPDRFLFTLFAPAGKREALWALTAFNHELVRARAVTTQPITTLIRLQWWRDAVTEAEAGKPPRQHEIALPLHAAITAGTLHAPDLHAMIDAREIEAEETMPTEADFLAWLRGTAGGWSVAAGRALGAHVGRLRALGAAYGLAQTLRAVPALARDGRCLLPDDVLEAHGTSHHAVLANPIEVRPAVLALAQWGAVMLAEDQATPIPRGAVAAALPGVLARRDLRHLVPPGPRGVADKLAVAWAGFSGRV